MLARIKISHLINDPTVLVKDGEDLNLDNNILCLVIKAMNIHDGDKIKAAHSLGITVRCMYNYLGYNPIIFDTKEKKYISISSILHNSDEKNRYLGILPPKKRDQKNGHKTYRFNRKKLIKIGLL